MIRYQLTCKDDHRFEGWFRSSGDFDKQSKRGVVACPTCGNTKISKALMAPSVVTRKGRDAAKPKKPRKAPTSSHISAPPEVMEMLRKVRREVEAKAEYVGPKFAEEARKIHYEESEGRGIWGEASVAEAKALVDEGIDVMPLPVLPEDQN
jgi:hypothetical protein